MRATERAARWFRRGGPGRIALYALLICLSTLYMLPFLWLMMTSVKVDREFYTRDPLSPPAAPNALAKSPFIDAEFYGDRVTDLQREWVAVAQEAVATKEFPLPEGIDRVQAERQMALGLMRKAESALPPDEWSKGRGTVRTQLDRIATHALLGDIFQTVYRRLILGRMSIRSNDLAVQELGERIPMGERLHNLTAESAQTSEVLDLGTPGMLVRYDLTNGSRLVFENTFDTDFDAAQLQRLQLSLRPDDNWQRLRLTIERNGARYESVRPIYLANTDWVTMTWQEPGPDDQSNRIKSWVHIVKKGEGGAYESAPRRLKVTLSIERTTLAQAWMGKLWLNYQNTLNYIPVVLYVRNSVVLIVLSVTLMLLASSLVAYGVSRLQWPGRDLVFLLILATLMVPEQVTMIPVFLIWKNLGLYNTWTPLWLPAAFGAPFSIFLLRQFMKGIPRDIEDAAKIDGCGYLRIYWHIMLPLVRPTLAALALLATIGAWNDFKGVLLYVSDQRLYTLAFGLYAFSVQVANNPAQTMAASLMAAAPIIALFFVAQRHFIRGVTLTGMR